MTASSKPYSNKGDLTTGPVHAHLTRLTVPMIWGIMAIITVQLTDTYFISLMGTKELAGISFTFPVTLTITHLLFGLNIAVSSVVSRLAGAKKIDDVRRVVLHSLIIAFSLSCVVSLAAYVGLNDIFRLMGADGDTMVVVWAYMPMWLVSFVVLSVPINSNSAMRAMGDSLRPAIGMTAMALTNVILDPLLIFGLFGFPEMGVRGAAVATTVAHGVVLVVSLYFLIKHKNLLALDGLHLDKFKDSLKRIGFIALPAGITTSIQPFTNMVVVSLLAVYGTQAVAAYGVAMRVEAFAMIIIFALSSAMSPVIGQNWGAQNYGRVHQTINLSIGFNLVWSLCVAIILALFARSIAGIFTDDPEIIRLMSQFFWIVPITYGIGNLVFGWSSAFNAMGMPQRSFVMIVVRSIVLTLPLVYIGGHFNGVTGIFCALATVNLVSGLFFHWISWRACHRCEREALESCA